ncbi:hypothetical protein DVH24_024736 [Malus domestica]|uniref:Remorin C-terminal domain-containing protein n=1 Tax=Malus domestica TaxID=3750 RepID=A0A498JN92_MALDO|nr:hypothetical protein DVH24_024736 [Malus domestica]
MAQELLQKKKEDTLSFIKTWEEKQKTKVDNKANKRLAINEERKNADQIDLEAEEKKIETKVEKHRHRELEKLKNKEAHSAKIIEDSKVRIEAKRNKGHLNVEKKADKFRNANTLPTKCFGMCLPYSNHTTYTIPTLSLFLSHPLRRFYCLLTLKNTVNFPLKTSRFLPPSNQL